MRARPTSIAAHARSQLDSPVADPHLSQFDLDGTDEALDDPNGFSYTANADGGPGSIALTGSA